MIKSGRMSDGGLTLMIAIVGATFNLECVVSISNLIPDPLHPAIVHFPVVLAVLSPLVVGAALYRINRGGQVRTAWLSVVATLSILAAGAVLSVQTGGAQAERVERTVGEQAVDLHEEAAERFEVAALLVFALGGLGLWSNNLGRAARGAVAVGSVVLLGMVWSVGHSGGRLVYGAGGVSSAAAAGGTASGEAEETEGR